MPSCVKARLIRVCSFLLTRVWSSRYVPNVTDPGTGEAFVGCGWHATQSVADLCSSSFGSHKPHVHSLKSELSVSVIVLPETTSLMMMVLLMSKCKHIRAFIFLSAAKIWRERSLRNYLNQLKQFVSHTVNVAFACQNHAHASDSFSGKNSG